MRTERVPVADGVELAVDRWPADGAGRSDGATTTPFLLVHGLASNARLWDGVAEALAGLGHEAFTVDLRGHGRSSKPDGGYDVATVADDLAALIERMGIDRPIAAGQSWGGNVVLELAARHPAIMGRPSVVRGIALVDGGWIELADGFPDLADCLTALAPPRLEGRPLSEVAGWIHSAHADWPDAGVRGTLANFEVRPDGTIAPWLTFDRHMLVLTGLWEHHPTTRYASSTVPVLLIPAAGSDGRADAKRRAVEAAEATIPHARTRWLSGDHDLHAQHPVEVAEMLHEMVADGFAP
ncbi:MAG: alpha/beta fold hydrolase [Candidatus Limnocylindrales bacterium]